MAVAAGQLAQLIGMLGQGNPDQMGGGASPGIGAGLTSQSDFVPNNGYPEVAPDMLMEPDVPRGTIQGNTDPEVLKRISSAELTGEWTDMGDPAIDAQGRQLAAAVKSSMGARKKLQDSKSQMDATRIALAKLRNPVAPTGAAPNESMIANGIGALLSLFRVARPQFVQQGVQNYLGGRLASQMPAYNARLADVQGQQALGTAQLQNLSGDMSIAQDEAKSSDAQANALQKIIGELAARNITAQSRTDTSMMRYVPETWLRKYATDNGLDPAELIQTYQSSPSQQKLLAEAYAKTQSGDLSKVKAENYPAESQSRIKLNEAHVNDLLGKQQVYAADAGLKNWAAKKLAALVEYIPQEERDKHQKLLSEINENLAQAAKARADSNKALASNNPTLGKDAAARWDKHLTEMNKILGTQITALQKQMSDVTLFDQDGPAKDAKIKELQTRIDGLDKERMDNADRIGRPLGYEPPKGWLQKITGADSGKALAPSR